MKSSAKNSRDSDKSEWKEKFQELMHTCQSELKRTTELGKKMFSASRSNSQLHEVLQELGSYIVSKIQSGEIKIEDEKVASWVNKAKELEAELKKYDDEMKQIKSGGQ